MKYIISSLLALLRTKNMQLEPGLRVNYAPHGYVKKYDGIVVAMDKARGVLVAWPRGGSDWLSKSDLAVIC